MSRSRAKASRPDPAAEARQAGLDAVRQHVAFRYLSWKAVLDEHHDHVPSDGWAVVSSDGSVYLHPRRHGSPGEWAWVVAHALLHLGLGHAPDAERSVVVRPQPGIARAAAQCVVANRFLAGLHFGQPPQPTPADLPDGDEDRLTQQWAVHGVPAQFQDCGSGGSAIDVLLQPGCGWPDPVDWQAQFAAGLTDAVAEAIEEAGGSTPRRPDGSRRRKTEWERALGWFVSNYPLLGAVASGMTIVADRALAQQWDISVAAVNASAGEIYINPLASLDEEEWQFVLGHEMLHAALRHADRCGARDPYLYNVACDYVVNLWLVEMRVGTMPYGCLYDASLAGLSAEEVYDRLAGDLRRLRRLATLRGKGRPDVLGDPLPRLGEAGRGVELDDFYRRALLTGLTYHQSQERGLLPSGLVQEIRALEHPPLPWDAQLARWFDEYVPARLPIRTFARPSRRQAATPDIPRAGRYLPEEAFPTCTFGVVLDTSASMPTRLLGKALGAIASYAEARDVRAARVVFCDAAAYDAGYLPVAEIAGRVKVKGRGGTVLQPGIDLLQTADDFPDTAPILVITDGECDVVNIRREHAYLVPRGARLPFTPRGPVFGFR